MPPKKVKPDTRKPVKVVRKSDNKSGKKKSQSKIKKKRRNLKVGPLAFTFPLLPKRKRLAKKVVTKLNNETDRYMLARGLDTIKRLHHYDTGDIPDKEERQWRMVRRATAEHKKLLDDKTKRVLYRARHRRQRTEERRKQELRRKRYRVHPDDHFHKYKPGFKRTRHRISKSRFMRCIDIPLFLEVLNDNKELADSPLWEEKLSFKNMSAERCEQLKDHLYQFDVIVECLKQGIFDMPGCDDFDLHRVRRKRKPGKRQNTITKVSKKSKQKKAIQRRKTVNNISDERINVLHRRQSFPPYERASEVLGGIDESITGNWFNRVTTWIGSMNIIPAQSKTESLSKKNSVAPSKIMDEDRESALGELSDSKVKPNGKGKKKKDLPLVEHTFRWSQSRKTSLKSFPPRKSIALGNEGDGDMADDDNDLRPFADFITLTVPNESGNQKRFIRTLVERKESNFFVKP